jgi:GT2 family glycosyltransferase
VVAVDHGVSPSDGFPLWLRTDFAYLKSRLYGKYLPKATQVVTISEFLRGQLPSAIADRTRVIPWGSEHYGDVPAQESSDYRRGLRVEDDSVLSLYVGRLNQKGQPYKGIEELLDHYRALSSENAKASLLCVGFGDEADAAAIRRTGGRAVVNAPPREVAVAYGAADIVVTCSKWEGFGLPLVEAQSFGVPVVAYARGAHPEICEPGQTALLAQTQDEFREHWRRLIDDPDLRERMGRAGAQHARRFSWNHSVEEHERVLEDAANVGGSPSRARLQLPTQVDSGVDPLVSVIVLTYRSEREMLSQCLESIGASDYSRVELVVVDNGSGDGIAAELTADRPNTKYVQMDRNLGFSGGINRGVEASTGTLCFILNPDTVIDPTSITELVSAARRHPNAVGFAAKMLFLQDRDAIDSIGIALDEDGAAFNRGIGQFDIGQYDEEELVLGSCFGAALIRRDAFQPLRVGPLDENYFLYYEDVDWCLRATLQGEDFWTVPKARVYHHHSATTRDQAYGFKHRHIQRNLLYTIFKGFEKRRAIRIFQLRTKAHLVNIVRNQYPLDSMRIIVGSWLGVIRYWGERHVQQRRRIRPDRYFLRLGSGEKPYFDPVAYRPALVWENLEAMVKRLWLTSGDPRWERCYAYLQAAGSTALRYRPTRVLKEMEEIASPLPGPLVRFMTLLAEEPETIEPEHDLRGGTDSDVVTDEGARTA